MTNDQLDILASKLADRLLIQPRWLRLKQAALYSSIGQKKLKQLAEAGDIAGYSDPNSKRGDWIFDRESLDSYRLKPITETNIKINKILAEIKDRY